MHRATPIANIDVKHHKLKLKAANLIQLITQGLATSHLMLLELHALTHTHTHTHAHARTHTCTHTHTHMHAHTHTCTPMSAKNVFKKPGTYWLAASTRLV